LKVMSDEEGVERTTVQYNTMMIITNKPSILAYDITQFNV